MFANISGYVCYICYIVIFFAESLIYRVVVLGEEAGAAMQMKARQRNLLITQEVAKLWILVKMDLPQITVVVFVVAAMEVISYNAGFLCDPKRFKDFLYDDLRV